MVPILGTLRRGPKRAVRLVRFGLCEAEDVGKILGTHPVHHISAGAA